MRHRLGAAPAPLAQLRAGGLVTALAMALAVAGVRVVIGERLPRWSLQVDVGLGNFFVSVIAVAGASGHTNLANLYLLVEVFALLYLPLRSALVHTAAAGVAYAVVLGVGPRTAEPPVVAWLSVFGTAVVLGAVVVGLVSVLRSAAREDPLTGLANRRMWDERFEDEMERAMRSGTALSVVMADLDGFKAINDAHGHEAGDRALQDLARAWRGVVRGGGECVSSSSQINVTTDGGNGGTNRPTSAAITTTGRIQVLATRASATRGARLPVNAVAIRRPP